MIRFLFRFAATLALAVAAVIAILDATRTVAAKTLVLTPLMTSWQATWPDSLASVRLFLDQRVAAFAWDPVLVAILSMPGFIVFALLALLLYAIGRKPRRRIGRFVIDS